MSEQQSSHVRYAERVTEYLTRVEAAALLRVHVSTIDRMRRAGMLAARRLPGGRAVRFRRADVLTLLTDEKGSGS